MPTITPYDTAYGAVGDGVTDDTVAMQAFFDAISATKVDAVCTGTFAISAGLFIGPATGSMQTLLIQGDATFVALNAIDTMITTRNCMFLNWNGRLTIFGTGGVTYSSRTCRIGLKIGDSGNTSRAKFDMLRVERFYESGISCKQLSTLTDLGNVYALDCGSGLIVSTNATYSLTANWSTRVDTGISASYGQRSTITVDALPPTTIQSPILVVIGADVHFVKAIDIPNSTLEIYPWIDTTLTSGTLRYMFGAGIYLEGGDAGIVGMDMVDVARCGVGLWNAALYGPVANRIVAQFCGAGFAVGRTVESSNVTMQINGIYCEANVYDFVRVTSGTLGLNIASEYGLLPEKMYCASAPRTSGNVRMLGTGMAMSSITLNKKGVYHSYEKSPRNVQDAGTFLAVDITAGPRYRKVYKRDSWTINLLAPSIPLNDAFGYDTGELIFLGTGTNNSPTGTFTFNAPAGSTVNGGASAAFSTFTGPAAFVIYYVFATADFIIARFP